MLATNKLHEMMRHAATSWTLGLTHPHVGRIQRSLVASGHLPEHDERGRPNIDSVYGRRTRAALQAYLRDLDYHAPTGLRIVRYDEPGGLDLRARGNYGTRYGTPPRLLVLHWPGFYGNATRLHAVMDRPTAKVSTHWGVDERGAYQYLPHDARAWHATWTNKISVGIDVCQSPLEADLHAERAVRGMRVDVAPNPTRRGERRVLTLDPGIAHNTRLLVERLCAELGIPMQAPRGPDGRVRHDVIATSIAQLGDFSGVVGHHHVDRAKWDVAPWWGALFDGTPLGD